MNTISNYCRFIAWDSGAATLGKYCKKGDIVDVVTSAKNKSWTDREGNKRLQTRFRVKEFKLFNNDNYQKGDEGNAEPVLSEVTKNTLDEQ